MVTLPATATSGQEPSTEVVLDTAPEKSERAATDTVPMAGTTSDTGPVDGAAADTAPESDNEVPERSSGVLWEYWGTPVRACQMQQLKGKLSPDGDVRVEISALLVEPLTDCAVLPEQ